ncbi:hypothetical protein C0995_009731, partial [Termitomyces sp. Mi166
QQLHAGAYGAMKHAYGYGLNLKKDKVWQTPHKAMAHAVKFNAWNLSAKYMLPITTILNHAPTHPPTIQYAAMLLQDYYNNWEYDP